MTLSTLLEEYASAELLVIFTDMVKFFAKNMHGLVAPLLSVQFGKPLTTASFSSQPFLDRVLEEQSLLIKVSLLNIQQALPRVWCRCARSRAASERWDGWCRSQHRTRVFALSRRQ